MLATALNEAPARADAQMAYERVSRTSKVAAKQPAEASGNQLLAGCIAVYTGSDVAVEGTFWVLAKWLPACVPVLR